jgi:hypothetical protein
MPDFIYLERPLCSTRIAYRSGDRKRQSVTPMGTRRGRPEEMESKSRKGS